MSVAISPCKILLMVMSHVLLWNVYIFCLVGFFFFHAEIFISTTMLKKLQGQDIPNAFVSSEQWFQNPKLADNKTPLGAFLQNNPCLPSTWEGSGNF